MRVAIQKNFTHNFKLASLVGWALPTNSISMHIDATVATKSASLAPLQSGFPRLFGNRDIKAGSCLY